MTNHETYESDLNICLFRIPRNGKRVIWEITNKCNYHCCYCIFSSTPQGNSQELDTPHTIRVIDELEALAFTHLKITGGEPFIRADLMQILSYAKDKGLKIDISTNASLIDKRIISPLAKLQLEMIHVSLDGHQKDIHEKIRGSNTFDPTLRGIKLLIQEGIRIRVGCVIFKDNENFLSDIADFCEKLGASEVIFSLMEPVGRLRDQTDLLCSKSIPELQTQLDLLAATKRIKISYSFTEKNSSKENNLCPGGEKFLFIDSGGHVAPCTWVAERAPSYRSSSNLRDHSLEEILHADSMLSYRKTAKELNQASCDCCPMKITREFQKAQNIIQLFEENLENKFQNNDYTSLSFIYPFTTENIRGYFDDLKLKNAKILTVGGSADHLINAYLCGADHVKCFDVNELSRYYAELKLEALKMWNLDTFKRFFLTESPNEESLFAFDAYQKIKSKLSLNARHFFDKAYEHFNFKGHLFRKSFFFRRKYENAQKQILYNPYLQSESAFGKVQQALQNYCLEWETESILNHGLFLKDQCFDRILLSNISDYTHKLFSGDYLLEFKDKIIMPMLDHLNPNGILMIGYVYDGQNKHDSHLRNAINDPIARKNIFSSIDGCSYKELLIESVIENDNQDIVLTLERRKA